MVAYIYVPATWAFAAILFGATLLIRKIVSPLIFGASLGLVMSVLVGTVLAQEVHIPRRLDAAPLPAVARRPRRAAAPPRSSTRARHVGARAGRTRGGAAADGVAVRTWVNFVTLQTVLSARMTTERQA